MTDDLIKLTADIVHATVHNNKVAIDDVPVLIEAVHGALVKLGQPVASTVALKPAVPIRQSITPAYLVCLEDGANVQMLKRYIRTRFDLSPDEYRRKWGLPADYPMVTPNYAARRAEIARASGLGQKGRGGGKTVVETVTEPVSAAVAAVAKAGRRKLGIVAAKAAAAVHLKG